MEERVKVRLEFPRNIVYQRVLEAWKQLVTDSKQAFAIFKATESIKRYPIAINGLDNLKRIQGIGDVIAARLEACWELYAFEEGDGAQSVTRVKATLTRERATNLVDATEKVKSRAGNAQDLAKGWAATGKPPAPTKSVSDPSASTADKPKAPRKRTVKAAANTKDDADPDDEFLEPEDKLAKLSRHNSAPVAATRPSKSGTAKNGDIARASSSITAGRLPSSTGNSINDDDDCIEILEERQTGKGGGTTSLLLGRTNSTGSTLVRALAPVKISSTAPIHRDSDHEGNDEDREKNNALEDEEEEEEEAEYVSIEPRDAAEVILVMDLAEINGNRRGTSVVEHLEKKSFRVERRRLHVGDYMWVARKLDGTEMCLDWVVERKTWADLNSSILKGNRYAEQKQRLRAAPYANRVYLIEGRVDGGEARLEQALATTMIHDNFLIQRCASTHKSAEFLSSVTYRLQEDVRVKKMTGVSFESVQRLSKKSAGIRRCRDVWTRMLMVVPGMSSDSACLVANRYPSMPALARLFRESDDPKGRLQKEIPTLSRALVSNLALFFEASTEK